LIVVLFAPLFLAVQSSPVMACQCLPRTSIHHLADADAVFTGRLTEIEGPLVDRLTFSSMDPVNYRFDVDRVLKGAVPVNATVRSVVSGGSCGLEQMSLGDRYTVFAVARDGVLSVGLCGGTHLGSPDPALAVVSGVLLAPTPGAPPWWALILVAIAVILGATVCWRRSRIVRGRRPTSSPD
jgi:hypothetical protein